MRILLILVVLTNFMVYGQDSIIEDKSLLIVQKGKSNFDPIYIDTTQMVQLELKSGEDRKIQGFITAFDYSTLTINDTLIDLSSIQFFSITRRSYKNVKAADKVSPSGAGGPILLGIGGVMFTSGIIATSHPYADPVERIGGLGLILAGIVFTAASIPFLGLRSQENKQPKIDDRGAEQIKKHSIKRFYINNTLKLIVVPNSIFQLDDEEYELKIQEIIQAREE